MGSFNMTCSISRLPITYGMSMRALVLAQPEKPAYPFYPTYLFVPLTTAVKGIYDDYGRIGECEPSESFDLACRHFFPKFRGDSEGFFEDQVAETSKTSLSHWNKPIKCKVDRAYIREDVYQEILKIGNNSDEIGGIINKENIAAELAELKESIRKTKVLFGSPDAQEMGIKWQDHITSGIMGHESWKKLPHLISLFRGGDGDYLQDAMVPYRDHLLDLLDKKPAIDEEAIRFAMEIAEHLQFNQTLRYLCITWQPTNNLVGQETPYDLQGKFYRAMHGICVKAIKEKKAQEREDRASFREWKKTHPSKGNAP